MSDIQAQLKDHLKNGKDWEKMATPVPGLNVVKVPATKSRPPLLFLEANPLKDDGKPLKRKGLYIGSQEVLLKFSELLNDDKTYQLIKEIEHINPETVRDVIRLWILLNQELNIKFYLFSFYLQVLINKYHKEIDKKMAQSDSKTFEDQFPCVFRVNSYITLELSDNETNIYINDEFFDQFR